MLIEAGTHLMVGLDVSTVGGCERKTLRSVRPGMLLMWDRGLHSYVMVESTLKQGCDYLGRVPANVKFSGKKI